MNREIKFRGKNAAGKWEYGSLIITNDPHKEGFEPFGHFIHKGPNISIPIPVDRNTIGQYSELKDRVGKDIYEGDIVKVPYINSMGVIDGWQEKPAHIVFGFGQFELKEYPANTPIAYWCMRHKGEYISNYGVPVILHEETYLEIIGNIHENSDLINP